MPRGRQGVTYTCLSPLSDPGNHGSDPTKSLQVAPFQSESNSIWIGYHNRPSKKYLGVFPSFDEVLDRCRRNSTARGANTSFPRFRTEIQLKYGVLPDQDCPDSYLRHVCCVSCQDRSAGCEDLILNLILVETGQSSGRHKKVFLLVYKFYLKGEQMVALVHHPFQGKFFFQKTDGTLSKVLALDSKYGCIERSPCPTHDSEYDSDTSSLTQFDCAEDENTTDARISPRVSLQSSQRHQLQQPTNAIVAPSPQNPLLPQGLPAPPRVRGCVVIDMTDEDEPSPVKQENTKYPDHLMVPIPYKTPSATPASTPSTAPSEESSFINRFGPDPLAEEYGRITTQIFQEYSMRVFALPEVTDLIQRMKQAVKAGDRAALCRTYGALQAFLITVE